MQIYKKFKIGEETTDVWAGDFVCKCEFVSDLSDGRMIFYDKTFKCFRLVFWEFDDNSNDFIMNGWKCHLHPISL